MPNENVKDDVYEYLLSLNQELKTTIENLKTKDDCKEEIEELKNENELLLLQLHQVQEELESY